MQNHDSQYAKILSNELSQIRKMNKMIELRFIKLALEQIQLRLNTITELGDVVITLSPAMSVIKGIQGDFTESMMQKQTSHLDRFLIYLEALWQIQVNPNS